MVSVKRTGLVLAVTAAVTFLAGATAALGDAVAKGRADAGKQVYARHCAVCHGVSLQGGSGPALTGAGFLGKWQGRSRTDLGRVIADTMPYQMPKLADADSADVTAFVVAQSGLDRPAGSAGAVPAFAALVSGPPVANVAPRAFEPVAARSPSTSSGAEPTDNQLRNVAADDWPMYNRTLKGDRYSPLGRITPANASKLRVKCQFGLGEVGVFQSSPVIYRGVIYINDRLKTFALDGRTCKKIWDHEWTPQNVDAALADARGVAIYDGKVFRGTADGHLLALDAKTGKLLWDTTVHDSRLGYSISMAVAAYDGKVFVGESGGDKGIKGRAWAFDAKTGQVIWAFDLIPTGNQTGAESWMSGQAQGGAAVWSTMTIDPARGEVIAPTGNPGPDFDGAVRGGDNLFTDSIVAMDLKTGKLAWWAQQVPHDTHDWDTGAAPVYYEAKGRGLISVAQKDGNIYVYDQATHALQFKAQMAPKLTPHDVVTGYDKPHEFCGGHGQYFGTAVDPATGTLFVGSEYRCGTVQAVKQTYVPGQNYYAGRTCCGLTGSIGFIQAFDGATGRKLWQVESPSAIDGAVTTTAGGVLFTGDDEGNFVALDQKTGKVLFDFFTGGAINGGVSVYGVGGEEYVAVATGGSRRDAGIGFGAATLMVFGL